MKKGHLVVAAVCLHIACGISTTTRAESYEGVGVKKILTSTTAANGQKLSYLRTDKPEVTALIVEVPAGGETGWHTHDVPVYAYMLGGNLTVEMEGGKKYEFKEGDAIFEVRDTPHNGRNNGRHPAKLVVFYTGEAGKSNVTRVSAPESLH